LAILTLMFYSSSVPYNKDAEQFYAAIADLPWAVWLDSGGRGRYDILTAQPVATLVTHGLQTTITDVTGTHNSAEDPFVLLRGNWKVRKA
jgi:para-aminobenzoate synthetase component 1